MYIYVCIYIYVCRCMRPQTCNTARHKKISKIKNALATYSPRRVPIKALLPKALYVLFPGTMKALVK